MLPATIRESQRTRLWSHWASGSPLPAELNEVPDVGALCPGAAIVGVEHVGAMGGGQHSPAADADVAHGGEERRRVGANPAGAVAVATVDAAFGVADEEVTVVRVHAPKVLRCQVSVEVVPSNAVIKGGEDTLSDAGCIKRVAEVGIAFGLLVEVGARPGVTVVAARHDALAEDGGENLPVVAVDAEDVAVQTVAARLPRGSVVEGTIDAALIGGDEHGVVVVGHEIGVAHVAGKSVRGVFALGAFGGLVDVLDVGRGEE